jgi:CubicO group peptidase (beta-lactamase class C family)
MSRIIATWAVLAVFAAACTPPASLPHTDLPAAAPSLAATPSNLSDQALAAELGAYMKQQAANLSFSGTALVARRGNLLLLNGYGAADRRWKRPNSELTQFRIASISKEFTAVAILLLHARGKVDVHDRMCVYITDCPLAWEDITVHQLLTHTSGIHDLYEQPGYTAWQATPMAPPEVMQHFIELPLDFPPGTSWRYTDSGYTLLGLIVERASGVPYAQFLQDNIFTPLGLTNTGILGATHLALGYNNCCDLTPADTSHPTVDIASGDLYSTVGDLYAWDQALFNDQFLSPDLRQMAFTPYEIMTDFGGMRGASSGMSYGYGSMVGDMYGHRLVGHPGRTDGYSSLNFYFPDDQVAVILLGNQRNPPVTSSIVIQLVSMIFKPAD